MGCVWSVALLHSHAFPPKQSSPNPLKQCIAITPNVDLVVCCLTLNHLYSLTDCWFLKCLHRYLILNSPIFQQYLQLLFWLGQPKNHAILPQNVNVGIIRLQTSEDKATFSDAAETTASQLAATWHPYACSTQPTPVCAPSQAQPTGTSLRSWKICYQLAEMHQSGLDSSILSPFLPGPDIDHPNLSPPPPPPPIW